MSNPGQRRADSDAPAPDSICAMPATALAAAIRAGELSPVEATDAVLDRIAALNPAINAVVTVTADTARAAARDAERALRRGDEVGPLHGVPYTLKDLTATRGVRTTYGAKRFEHNVADHDDLVAERLRDAGGVLVGKTNTPEEGCKGCTDNLVFGATANPWDLGRTPGGSSGGAAAAVAAGMAPLAEGSDFAGSIRIPAAFCGVVGVKPSDGRIPIVPNGAIWHPITFCYGPITRTVADAALMLEVMAGPDARDPRSLADARPDYREIVAGDRSLAGLRVGWTDDLGFTPVEPSVREACAGARDVFAGLGCELEQVSTDFSDAVDAYALLNANRRGALIEPYLPEWKDRVDPLMLMRAELAASRTATDAARAEIVQASVYARVAELFERYDLLLVPTTPVPAFPLGIDYPPEIDGVRIDSPFQQLPLTFLFNMTGHPVVSVPAGWTAEGLPVGIQIVAPWRDDARALRAAAAFEEAAPWADRWPALVTQEAAA